MKFLTINNTSDRDLDETEELFQSLGQYAQKEFGFKRPPSLNLVSDIPNSLKSLGKTAHYDPQEMSVSIYVDGRHPKDILRSFAHELVHHTQNENGTLDTSGYSGEGYAQKNKDLRNMESDAYERGNMCFRDWEDTLKQKHPTIYNERRIYKMSIKDWKNKELSKNLNKKWGFKMKLHELNESYDAKQGSPQAEADEADSDKVGMIDDLKEDQPYGGNTGDKSKTDPGKEDDEWRKGKKSKTDPGKEDDEWRKGKKSKTHSGLNKESLVKEDSSEEEGKHYHRDEMSDGDRIKEIERHLDALKKDRGYDEEHIDERQKSGGNKGDESESERDYMQESKLKKAIRKMILQEMKRRKNGRK